MTSGNSPEQSAAFAAILAQVATLRAQMLQRLNADIFAGDGGHLAVPPPTAEQKRQMRRERLKSLVQVRDISDWDEDY